MCFYICLRIIYLLMYNNCPGGMGHYAYHVVVQHLEQQVHVSRKTEIQESTLKAHM